MKYFVTPNLEVLTCEAPMRLGEVVQGHSHRHPHMTICNVGALRVNKHASKGGPVVESAIVRADSAYPAVHIEADVFHSLEALEEGTRYMCVHACHNEQGELTVLRTGWERPETVGVRLCHPDLG
jgi:hypothetical protein